MAKEIVAKFDRVTECLGMGEIQAGNMILETDDAGEIPEPEELPEPEEPEKKKGKKKTGKKKGEEDKEE